MKKRYLAAMMLSLAPGLVLASGATQQPTDKSFEGYVKLVKSHIHFELGADATYVETIDYGMKVMDEHAAGIVNHQPISFSKSMSEVKLLSAYTLKKDGKKIEVPKDNFQVLSNGGQSGSKPIFSDIETRVAVFPDVEAGDTVYMSYEIIYKEALFPKQFSFEKNYNYNVICEECEVSITAPASLGIKVESRDVKGGEVASSDGKRHWQWHFENHEIAKPEPYATANFDFAPRILASTFKNYAELATAYQVRFAPKAVVSDRVKKLAEDITKNATSEKDIAQALYYWVAQNINYAGNNTGNGTVVPHDVDHILDNRFGDCKDHVLVLHTLLAAKGIVSSPALINAGKIYTLPDLPVMGVFNHVITYIPSLNLYLDSTARSLPFGLLPADEDGKPVILTSLGKVAYTPATDNSKIKESSQVDITFNADGTADGTIKNTLMALDAMRSKQFFQQLEMTKYKDLVVKAALSAGGYKGTGEYTHYDDPKGHEDPYTYEVKFHVENAINLPGPGAIYISPLIAKHSADISRYVMPENMDKPLHDFPCTGGSASLEIVYHMPQGAEVMAIPKDVHLKNKYSAYDATYKQEGSTIRVNRNVVDSTPGNVCHPDIYDEFKTFDAGVTKDLRAQIIYR